MPCSGSGGEGDCEGEAAEGSADDGSSLALRDELEDECTEVPSVEAIGVLGGSRS
jgi:hypothetical protein